MSGVDKPGDFEAGQPTRRGLSYSTEAYDSHGAPTQVLPQHFIETDLPYAAETYIFIKDVNRYVGPLILQNGNNFCFKTNFFLKFSLFALCTYPNKAPFSGIGTRKGLPPHLIQVLSEPSGSSQHQTDSYLRHCRAQNIRRVRQLDTTRAQLVQVTVVVAG